VPWASITLVTLHERRVLDARKQVRLGEKGLQPRASARVFGRARTIVDCTRCASRCGKYSFTTISVRAAGRWRA